MPRVHPDFEKTDGQLRKTVLCIVAFAADRRAPSHIFGSSRRTELLRTYEAEGVAFAPRRYGRFFTFLSRAGLSGQVQNGRHDQI